MTEDAEEIRRAFRAYCERQQSPRLSWEARAFLRACVADARDSGGSPFLEFLAAEMIDHDGAEHLGPFLGEILDEGAFS